MIVLEEAFGQAEVDAGQALHLHCLVHLPHLGGVVVGSGVDHPLDNLHNWLLGGDHALLLPDDLEYYI